jgi:hypothetical protein
MAPRTLSERIKQDVSEDVLKSVTDKLESSLKLKDAAPERNSPTANEEASDEDDWEKTADKELSASTKTSKEPQSDISTSRILELYDFDLRIQMHQLVRDFTRIVDPTGCMPFRPKMVSQSLMLTFNNPKHGIILGTHKTDALSIRSFI